MNLKEYIEFLEVVEKAKKAIDDNSFDIDLRGLPMGYVEDIVKRLGEARKSLYELSGALREAIVEYLVARQKEWKKIDERLEDGIVFINPVDTDEYVKIKVLENLIVFEKWERKYPESTRETYVLKI